MEFLTAWLHQIVLIVLFAVILDLIIPSSSMQKYVKLVMGLVIMVTLLKPIGLLFDQKFDISRIQWPEQIKFVSLDVIESEAAAMQQEQLQRAQQQWEAQLEKVVKDRVESQFSVEVSQVGVQLAKQNPDSKQTPAIEQLTLIVEKKTGTGAETGIRPIQPVDIAIEPNSKLTQPVTDATGDDFMLAQIRQDLISALEIQSSAVEIHWNNQQGGEQ